MQHPCPCNQSPQHPQAGACWTYRGDGGGRREGGRSGGDDLLLGGWNLRSEGDAREFRNGAFGFVPGRQPAFTRATRSVSVRAGSIVPHGENVSGQFRRRCRSCRWPTRPEARCPKWSLPARARSPPAARWRRPGPGRTRRCPSCHRRRGVPRWEIRCRRSLASTRSAPRCATPSSTARTISARPEPRVRPTSVPRAPKSQSGVPRPSNAGTNQTSPAVSHCGGHGLGLLRRRDDPEVVAQPFDRRPGRQHHRFGAPGRPCRRRGRQRSGTSLRRRAQSPWGDCRARRTGRACRRCRTSPWPGRAACSPARRGRPAGPRRCRRSAGTRKRGGAPGRTRRSRRPSAASPTGSAGSAAVPRPIRSS